MKITVFGAGIIGVTTAYYLHKQGHEVTVLERNESSGLECSFANGGQLSYSHAEPWATPASLKKVPKWLFSSDSPLVMHPSLDPHMWSWAISFFKHCKNEIKDASTKNTLRLALHSRDCFAEIIKETGIEFSYLQKGTLHIFRDNESLAANITQAEFQKKLGCPFQLLNSRAACEQIEPALKHSPLPIVGGIFFPIDATGDVYQFTHNLTKYLEARGVQFLYGRNVLHVLSEGDEISAVMTETGRLESDAFVVSMGAASPILLRKIGINAPIYPMKGYSISVEITDSEKAPTVGLTDQFNKIVYSRLGNIMRVAGTAEFAGYNNNIDPERINTLKRMVMQCFPDAGPLGNTVKEWACLRPSTPEGTPILGNTHYKNLFLNTGHGTLGWTLSCGSADIVANIISGKPQKVDLTGLTLAKY